MKPWRVPANPSAQHIWKRLSLMPSKTSEGPRRQPRAEEAWQRKLNPHVPGVPLSLSGPPLPADD